MTGMVNMAARKGVFYGWVVVAACGSMAAICGGTFFFGFSALFEPIIREFGWSRAVTSVAYSLRAEVGGLEAPIIGALADRFGPRRVMRGGLFILSAGMLMIAATNSIWMFYGGFIVATVGMGAAGGMVGTLAITRWFERRRGRALGITTIGNAMGGIMVPVLAVLIANFGWRTALIVAAAYILIIGIPLTYIIQDRPQDVGMHPDGIAPAGPEPQHTGDGPGTSAGHTGAAHHPAPVLETNYGVKDALRTRAFWVFSIALAFVSLSGSAITTHLVSYFIQVGMPDAVAAMGMSAVALISLAGRIGFGFAADVYDKRYVMATAFAMQAFGCMALVLVQDVVTGLLVLLVLSPGFGGWIPVRPAIQAEYFGMRAFGTIQGFLQMVATAGGAIGPVLAGWMFDVSGSYASAWLLLGGLTLVSIPLMLFVLQRPQGGTPVRAGGGLGLVAH